MENCSSLVRLNCLPQTWGQYAKLLLQCYTQRASGAWFSRLIGNVSNGVHTYWLPQRCTAAFSSSSMLKGPHSRRCKWLWNAYKLACMYIFLCVPHVCFSLCCIRLIVNRLSECIYAFLHAYMQASPMSIT